MWRFVRSNFVNNWKQSDEVAVSTTSAYISDPGTTTTEEEMVPPISRSQGTEYLGYALALLLGFWLIFALYKLCRLKCANRRGLESASCCRCRYCSDIEDERCSHDRTNSAFECDNGQHVFVVACGTPQTASLFNVRTFFGLGGGTVSGRRTPPPPCYADCVLDVTNELPPPSYISITAKGKQ